jgi:hypothetical protein
MKKLIYGVAALAVAAMMVACGGKTTEGISKGSKSKMDSLSYAMGVNIATDISSNMPEMKFDWAVLAAQAEKSLFTVVKEGDEDKAHEEDYYEEEAYEDEFYAEEDFPEDYNESDINEYDDFDE